MSGRVSAFQELPLFVTNEQGDRVMEGQRFEKESFRSCQLYGQLDNKIKLTNVSLIDCRTTEGACMIGDGAELKNVVFHNFKCGDAIHIDTDAYLSDVKISGRYPKELLVKPFDVGGRIVDSEEIDTHFDISDYTGVVDMIGIVGRKVRLNPEMHVVVSGAWKTEVDWDKLGISRLSFWRLAAIRAKNTECVVSLPKDKEKKKGYLDELVAIRSHLGI